LQLGEHVLDGRPGPVDSRFRRFLLSVMSRENARQKIVGDDTDAG
jgi:hypothetical protein